MTDRIKYILDYIGGLRVALEGERNLWPQEQITQHLCLLNVLDSITNEIARINESIETLQSSQPRETEEA